ncbi:MAG: GNAT family N-acetyltransferase [Spirochaetales bacterium]|nr:GNAT family N-acetyltransferase [Spirochaetales bacterium]
MINFGLEIKLQSTAVILRPWEAGDAQKIVKSVTEPALWQYTTEKLTTEADVSAYVSRAIQDRSEGRRYSFAICAGANDVIVGSSSFGNVSSRDRRVEIGWTWLATEYHGSGLNTRVKFLMLRYSFEQLGAHRVEFKTDNANPRSCAALKKIGARREGVLRSHTLMHDGRYRDTVFYSILEEEWPVVGPVLAELAEQE